VNLSRAADILRFRHFSFRPQRVPGAFEIASARAAQYALAAWEKDEVNSRTLLKSSEIQFRTRLRLSCHCELSRLFHETRVHNLLAHRADIRAIPSSSRLLTE
jgi:hypothetical protein